MTEYDVRWAIEVESTSPEAAAELCREILSDPDSLATFFNVSDGTRGGVYNTADLTWYEPWGEMPTATEIMHWWDGLALIENDVHSSRCWRIHPACAMALIARDPHKRGKQ